jgi:hypothetical protein
MVLKKPLIRLNRYKVYIPDHGVLIFPNSVKVMLHNTIVKAGIMFKDNVNR